MRKYYVPVPNDKSDHSAALKIGNVLCNAELTSPLIFDISKDAQQPLILDPAPSKVEREPYKLEKDSESSSDYGGAIASFLQLFQFGGNTARAGTSSYETDYDCGYIRWDSFDPSDEFLTNLGKQAAVKASFGPHEKIEAFLITGLVTASNVKVMVIEKGERGYQGKLDAGPASAHAKKSTRDRFKETSTIKGPEILGYRIMKLTSKRGKLTAQDYRRRDEILGRDRGGGKPDIELCETDIVEGDEPPGTLPKTITNEFDNEAGILFLPE